MIDRMIMDEYRNIFDASWISFQYVVYEKLICKKRRDNSILALANGIQIAVFTNLTVVDKRKNNK